MKKLFVLLLAVMAVMSVSAQTKLTLGGQSANGNWSWGTSKTMGSAVALHFGNQWGEFTLASAPGEATGCKLVVAEPNAKINLVVKHADGNNEYIAVDAAEKEVTFASAATLVELQATEAAQDLEVKSFVLVGADGTETQTSYAENWGVSTYGGVYTSTSQWAQVMLNGAEQTDPQIITFHCNAPVPAGLQLKVLNEDGTESYLGLAEGQTEPAIEIDNAVKEVSLQFTAADLTIDIAYVTTQPVSTAEAQATIAFGTTTDTRAFTAQTVLASVNGWESEVLPDGNRVAITQTPAGMGKFWGAQNVMGTWSNEAALAEFNKFTGITITDADLSEGSTLKVAANSNGSVAANLDLYLDAQTLGQKVTLYTTAFGWNCPLDEITVTGLECVNISYATNDGDGFVATPTFTQVKQGLNLLKITGYLKADKHVQVTSPTVCEVGTTKVGFQLASYKVENADPVAISSWKAVACANYPENWGWYSDQVVSGYSCTIEKYTNGSYKVRGWDGNYCDDFEFTEGTDDWGYPVTATVNGVAGDYATLAYSGSDFYGVYNYVPYNYVEGLGEENGYIILYCYFGDTWGTTYLAWGDYITSDAYAYTAKTPKAEPAVAAKFNGHKTCFIDRNRANDAQYKVTLVNGAGASFDIVETSDNYCLADYSCDVTSFILASELPAGNYTLTIPAGAMVVDDPVDYYVFNKEAYVLNFTVADGVAAAKLAYRDEVDAIQNVAVQSSSSSVKKVLRNGKIVIVKGNNEYNVAGALLK